MAKFVLLQGEKEEEAPKYCGRGRPPKRVEHAHEPPTLAKVASIFSIEVYNFILFCIELGISSYTNVICTKKIIRCEPKMRL